jgi:hypothetical protein
MQIGESLLAPLSPVKTNLLQGAVRLCLLRLETCHLLLPRGLAARSEPQRLDAMEEVFQQWFVR